MAPNQALLEAIRAHADPVRGAASDYDGLLEQIGDARLVLLGEATHGTHEFYRERARITARLLAERGFHALAVEADWPDAYRVNRYVRGEAGDAGAADALAGFQRFPHWMWRNAEMVACIDQLRAFNDGRPSHLRAGFYGLDLYSLFTSMDEVLHYLAQVDPPAARQARDYVACFDQHGADTQAYGYAAGIGIGESCQEAVNALLDHLQRRAADYAGEGPEAQDAYFHARQNARLVKNAEEYYRTMFRGRVSSWNLRDRHMADTLDDLLLHLGTLAGEPAKVVVWAHNSHLGDARATEVHRQGELNLGQLVRERYPGQACLVGFTTYDGQVMAASEWDGPAWKKDIVPALADSYEAILHASNIGNFVLPLRAGSTVATLLTPRHLHRAIGVIYRPETERASHYLTSSLAEQFDAVVHIDRTAAVAPLTGMPDTSPEFPETYPEGV